MSDLEVWLVIGGMTVVTLVTRAGFLVVPEAMGLPGWLARGLRYAPACALVAIIVPELGLGVDLDEPFAFLANPKLVGMLAGVAVFLASRSMLATIGTGMLVFTLVRNAAALGVLLRWSSPS